MNFRCTQCKLHWQSTGDFLCVKVDRHTKTKKTMFCNLELFKLREKGCPIETVEMKGASSLNQQKGMSKALTCGIKTWWSRSLGNHVATASSTAAQATRLRRLWHREQRSKPI